MKIAFLGIKGLPAKGGAERVVEAVVKGLAAKHEITVYCNARYTPEGTRIPQITLIRVPTLQGKHLQPGSLFFLSCCHALLLGRYDLLHIHNIEACLFLPLLRIRYRVVATAHGQPYLVSKWGLLVRKLMRLAELFYIYLASIRTSVSRPCSEYFETRYERRVHYIPNCVDVSDVPNNVSSEARNGPDRGDRRDRRTARNQSSYIVFAAGRIIPEKGCHLLLEAFSKLGGEKSLLIIGNLSQSNGYAGVLKGYSTENVTFIPFLELRRELFDTLRKASLFVFPSKNEAMSMMLLEAGALGVPIICSDLKENIEVLGDHALYFHAGSVRDLQTKLEWAYENPEEMETMGNEARLRILNTFSPASIVALYNSVYAKMR